VLSFAETGVHPACSGCAPPVFVRDLAVVSTGGIQRNLTPTQTRDLTITAVILVIATALVVIGGLVVLVVMLVRHRRRRRDRHPRG